MSNKLNLEVKQGEDFYRLLTIRDENNDLVDLTGHQFRSQIRASHTSDVFLEFSFNITGLGTVEMTLSNTLSSAKTRTGKGAFVYDVEWDTGSKKIRLLEGFVTFSPEVTK